MWHHLLAQSQRCPLKNNCVSSCLGRKGALWIFCTKLFGDWSKGGVILWGGKMGKLSSDIHTLHLEVITINRRIAILIH